MHFHPAPLKVGIAGLGRLGRYHAENLALRVPGVDLCWACSADAGDGDYARQVLGVRNFSTDLQCLLEAPELDAIVLVTPTGLHADQAIAVLEAGKHVLVEKPLALNVADCERVQAVARRHPQQVAMVGYMRRFDPSYQNAYQSIAQGDLGRPFLVRSQTCDRYDESGFFVRFAPQSGGIFMDCSVHDIDLARWLLGRPKVLRAYASGSIACHPELAQWGDVDNGLAVVDFEGGAHAVFYASRTFAHGHESQTEVIATAGKLVVGDGAARDRVVYSDRHGVRHLATGDFLQRYAQAFLAEMTHFSGACRGQHACQVTLDDATEATRIACALTDSLRNARAQTF
jgi:myo-inositol 2-dehydrogenase/D-chiro-inositol 1-dehydrogenase